MESVVRKCLNVREKCFEDNSCPIWLLSILPTRIKSVESIVDNDNELKLVIDLQPFKLNNSIPILNEEYLNPNSFSNQLFKNYSQLICSPSNEQLFHLFNKLKQLKQNKTNKTFEKNQNKCKQINCLNNSIPLTEFCQIHLLENDFKQILFVKCNQCKYLSIKQDKNNILHFCFNLN